MIRNEEAPGLREQVQGADDQLAGGSRGSVSDQMPARQMLAANPYGLSLAEVRAEARRCLARGWQLWEIRQRFTHGERACVTHVRPADQAFSRLREEAADGEAS